MPPETPAERMARWRSIRLVLAYATAKQAAGDAPAAHALRHLAGDAINYRRDRRAWAQGGAAVVRSVPCT